MKQPLSLVNDMFGETESLSFEHKDLIIDDDDIKPLIYVLEDGYVRQFVTTQSGEELSLHIYKPGSIFPVVVYMAKANNRFAFQALGTVHVRPIDPDLFMQKLVNKPELLLDLNTNLSKGLLGLTIRLEHTLFSNAYMKVASLIDYFVNSFGDGKSGFIELAVPFTHQDLANWLGLARETVSRQIEQLQADGIVKYNGNTLLVNKQKLSILMER